MSCGEVIRTIARLDRSDRAPQRGALGRLEPTGQLGGTVLVGDGEPQDARGLVDHHLAPRRAERRDSDDAPVGHPRQRARHHGDRHALPGRECCEPAARRRASCPELERDHRRAGAPSPSCRAARHRASEPAPRTRPRPPRPLRMLRAGVRARAVDAARSRAGPPPCAAARRGRLGWPGRGSTTRMASAPASTARAASEVQSTASTTATASFGCELARALSGSPAIAAASVPARSQMPITGCRPGRRLLRHPRP